ncbi:MAG: chemotaxis protein CheA [Magnetococcales bacterium]|nr:chemotaxis protein CheA [Magnetococcales bacterium]MBF0114626.1 chemotaxis protein CheA [Magnetococcales bacterium]
MAVEIDTSAFTEEAYELLSELEDSLLELEERPTDVELISRVFRAMHTIKGSGAMFGFDEVAKFTHEVETVFDMARSGSLPVTKALIDLTLAARDQIRSILDASRGGPPANQDNANRIIAGLRALAPQKGGGAAVAAESKASAPKADVEGPHVYRVRFEPRPEIFSSGTNPLLLLNELRDMGQCRVVALTNALPSLEDLDPERCYTQWEIFLTTSQGENAIRDVFIFVEDDCTLNVRLLDRDEIQEEAEPKKLGEILLERGDITEDALGKALTPLGDRLVSSGVVPADKVRAALTEQRVVQEQKQQQSKAAEVDAVVRVPSTKLDKLVNLVGELVTVQARLNQISGRLNNQNLQLVAEEIERLTAELRDNTMSIRMLAIGSTFNKFKRLVRDLSTELGKQIELTTAGADTELDKTVIDQLNDPLVHIIRNSIDHGIEKPDVRALTGKPLVGQIHLSAVHSGTSVLIQVKDDGKGLDPQLLRRKAVEKGLLSPDAVLSDSEAFMLIFGAGFSTAEKITNVSGRGVGMDVVRKSIESLRGTIDVQSALGLGTTITLKLPLTLAIIEGLLVGVNHDFFVLPLAAVEECVELSPKDIANSHGRRIVNVRGEIVPFIRIRERFAMEGERPVIEQIVIANVDGRRVGFGVDTVIGQHQTVIKNLGDSFQYSDEFSGATILGDGTVALLLDLARMVRYVEMQETKETGGA